MQWSPEKVKGLGTAIMDDKKTNWIKKEEANEFLDEPLGASWFTDCIKEDPGLNLGWDETENNNSVNTLLDAVLEAERECCPPPLLVPKAELFLEDPQETSCSTDFIKEDPELNLEDDENETIMEDPTRYASDTTRLIQNIDESCCTSFQETVHQGMVHDELKIEEKSRRLTTYGSSSEGIAVEEDRSIDAQLNCNSREKEVSKNFCCSVCLHSFPSKYRLTMHVFIHIDCVQSPIYICKSCGEVFSSNDRLNKHLKITEADQVLYAGNSEVFDCDDHCENDIFFESDKEVSIMGQFKEKQPSSKETWKPSKMSVNHIGNAHTIKSGGCDDNGTVSKTCNVSVDSVLLSRDAPYRCNVCGKSFAQLRNLKLHTRIHTGERPHKCSICDKSFTQLGALKDHLLTHTGKRPHKCKVCGKTFKMFRTLKIHFRIHTGEKPHECNVCGKSFTQWGGLKSHLITHTTDRPHKCDICGKSFSRLGSLKKHALTHTGKKRAHKCQMCEKSFTRLSILENHLLIHAGKRPHKCDFCGKCFTWFGTLRTHLLIHTGKRKHKCDICGKLFAQSGNLRSHKLIHTGKRPHKCNICSKSFTEMSTLRKHKLIHSGERPHKCDVCGKSFTLSYSLKDHLRIHTGERPHKCHICNKSFIQLGALKSHVLIHTGKRLESCDVCGRSFTDLGIFKKHALMHARKTSHK